jgi:hypothetical protein
VKVKMRKRKRKRKRKEITNLSIPVHKYLKSNVGDLANRLQDFVFVFNCPRSETPKPLQIQHVHHRAVPRSFLLRAIKFVNERKEGPAWIRIVIYVRVRRILPLRPRELRHGHKQSLSYIRPGRLDHLDVEVKRFYHPADWGRRRQSCWYGVVDQPLQDHTDRGNGVDHVVLEGPIPIMP